MVPNSRVLLYTTATRVYNNTRNEQNQQKSQFNLLHNKSQAFNLQNFTVMLWYTCYERISSPRTVQEQKIALREEWDNIQQGPLPSLVGRKNDRYIMCLSVRGGYSSYEGTRKWFTQAGRPNFRGYENAPNSIFSPCGIIYTILNNKESILSRANL